MPRSSSPPGKGRSGCGLKFAAGLVVLLGIGIFLAQHFGGKGLQPAECTVRAAGAVLRLTPEQAANAATIAAVATSRGLPERAVAIALATSLQESRLENIDHGDRDSLGLFQQRPSQGWGTARQIMDPVYASNAFFSSLVKIRGYAQLPLTVAAQRVQRSGYPEAYAQHEADATTLSAALSGRDADALSCTTGGSRADSAGGGPGDTAAVTALLKREFGKQARPRTDALPRTVAVPPTPGGAAAKSEGGRRGWELAQWAVAHAPELKVEQVAFGTMRWQAAKSGEGWQKQKPVSAARAGADASAGTPADGLVRITVAG
ncbi:heavy metal transporter [Actinacidiphila acidipaludis]|uniref:Heavy metal transporter n=1 Tax=Actinacidiphila acidipaludis TaxID=2873382 RepID=A0ABS7Q1L3_9ACTN|nr:heavy metal transporter [Streptomyces acidipaludis]MBY8877017.1 heavy metal transporter [Streptomyces acidipaludis]